MHVGRVGRGRRGNSHLLNFKRSCAHAESRKPQEAGQAYSALGIVHLKTGDYEEAEKDLKAAADLCKAKPDPSIWYHLALAQDHRRKFRAALNSVEQALQLASANPELQKMAEVEHERLTGYVRNSPDSGGTRNPD